MTRATPHPHMMRERLVRLRRAMRALLLVKRTGWVIAGLIALGVVAALVDYALRWPASVRVGLLGVTLGVALVVVWRRVWPVLRFRPSVEEIALRLERTDAGRSAGLVDRLASGVSLAEHHADEPLARAVIDDAQRRFAGVSAWSLLSPGASVVAVGCAALALSAMSALWAYEPTLAWIGTRRVLTPWTDVSWPKRTGIAGAGNPGVHPLGAALPLQAALLKSPRPDEQSPVTAHWRLVENGRGGPEHSGAMTSQGRGVRALHPDERGALRESTGTLFERLIEPVPGAGARADLALEYWFSSDDDRTEPASVRLVPPPVIESARLIVRPPDYLGAGEVISTELPLAGEARAGTPRALERSPVVLALSFNKPLPGPEPGDERGRRWIARTLGEALAQEVLGSDEDAGVTITGASAEIRWRAGRSVRAPVHLIDEWGIEGTQELTFRVDVIPDRAPEVTITQPAEDTDVLASTVLPWSAEARDDLGVLTLRGQVRRATRAPGSAGAAPEATGEPVEIGTRTEPAPGARSMHIGGSLSVAQCGAKPGDELWLSAHGSDAYPDQRAGGRPAISPVRKLRVISPEQLTEQAWGELAGVRRGAIRAGEQLQRLREELSRGRELDGALREQAAAGEAIDRLGQQIVKLTARLGQAGLNDPELAGVIREAQSLARSARATSGQAEAQLQRAQQAKRDAAPTSPHVTQAQAHQDGAERQLEDLARVLDRGQDAWSSRRSVERLLQDQQALRDRTGQLGPVSVGKSVDDLSPELKRQVSELGEQQDELARRLSDAVKKMNDTAKSLAKSDPSTSAALSQAASRASTSGVSEQMRQAADQARKNQQQSAQQSQDGAIATLKRMLDEIKQAQQNRDATLKRELASLVESLRSLILQQRTQLEALETLAPTGSLGGLDAGMIRLRTQSLGVLEQSRASGNGARAVSELLDSAAGEQLRAIGALRASTIDASVARGGETQSLRLLSDALAAAQKLAQEAQGRDEQRQRAELLTAYRELLLEQTELRAQSSELPGTELDRRQRQRARELSDRQDKLRVRAKEVLDKTPGLNEAELFALAHGRLDVACGTAAKRLSEGIAGSEVERRQGTAVAVLRSLVDALAPDQDRPEFREGGGGGGGSSGQGKPQGVVPPIAQLKLLRSMQGEALEMTRSADEASGDEARAARRSDAAALQQQLRDKARAILKKMEEQQ